MQGHVPEGPGEARQGARREAGHQVLSELTTPEGWDRAYEKGARPGWDMNGPTPLVDELLALAAASGFSSPARVAVPGCGYGHDAVRLASLGHDVTGVDFAPLAIAGARARYGDAVTWVVADWLHDPFPSFDLVFDHTCFVAFEPHRRTAIVAAHAERLRPGGLWLAAFFHSVPELGGPPFAISEAEARAHAEERFDVLHLGPATSSHPARAGREFLLVARR